MHILKLLLKIGAWFMIAIATIVLIISFFIYRHTRQFVESASHAQGTVIQMVEKVDHDSDTVYSPVYTFLDSKGQQHEIHSPGWSYPPAYKVGDTLTVLYPPDMPDKAKIDRFLEVWLWPAMLAGFGCIDLVIGLVLLVVVFIVQRAERRPPVTHAT